MPRVHQPMVREEERPGASGVARHGPAVASRDAAGACAAALRGLRRRSTVRRRGPGARRVDHAVVDLVAAERAARGPEIGPLRRAARVDADLAKASGMEGDASFRSTSVGACRVSAMTAWHWSGMRSTCGTCAAGAPTRHMSAGTDSVAPRQRYAARYAMRSGTAPGTWSRSSAAKPVVHPCGAPAVGEVAEGPRRRRRRRSGGRPG